VRVATFNLLHGMPVTGGRPTMTREEAAAFTAPPPFTDVRPLREAVGALDADVLGLQEVDVHQPRSGGHHQVREMAEATGSPYWLFAPSLRGTPGVERSWVRADHDDDDGPDDDGADRGPRYGVALLSRLPVLEWRTTRFDAARWSLPLLVPAPGRPRLMRIPDEPRAAVAAVLAGPHGPMTVATVHLSFVPGYNAGQLRALRAWLADMPRPLLLLGDLNLPGGLPARVSGWHSLARMPTYPSYRPRVQFDHVLADGLDQGLAARARAQALTLPVSDHCALVVEVPLEG
jgi:endonuclease/exonuclease/phosphatase family metal-dependent hydrolase